MSPPFSDKALIFTKRATIAGLSLAVGLSLVGCPAGHKPATPVDPAKIISVFTIGTLAMETQESRALKMLTDALHLAPEEPAIWANLGLYRLHNNELDAAAFDFERARSLMPANADTRSRAALEALLALAADRKGDTPGAIQHYKQAVSLNPTDLLNLYTLAQMLDGTGNDTAGALLIMREITKLQPENLEAWLQTARFAAKQNDLAAFREAVAALDRHSAKWPADAREQLALLKTAAQSGNVQRAAVNTTFLRNLLKQEPEWFYSYTALNPPLDQHNNPIPGIPFEQFVKLPNMPDSPAPPDMAVTFTPAPIKEPGNATPGAQHSTPSGWAGPLWVSNVGTPPTLVAPFPMSADGHALHIDSTAYTGLPLPFPGGPNATPPGPNGVLTLDYNYDLLADILLAGAGGIKLYGQGANGQYTDITAPMKLPAGVTSGSYVGAWGLDYDSDGDIDVLLARVSGPPLILRNNGDGTFKPVEFFSSVHDLRGFVYADVDGDGTPDAILLDAQGKVHVFINQHAGQYKERPVPVDIGNVAAITVADIDHDGRLDILLLRTDGALVRLTAKPVGAEWDTATLTTWQNAPKDLKVGDARLLVGDLDNNGALDLVASTPTTAQVWMNDGKTLSPLPASIPVGITALADIDNDGRLDLLGIDAQGAPVLLTNRGAKNYAWQDIRPRANQLGEVLISQNRQNATAVELNKRMNSYGIGGTMEMRAGLLFQKHLITAPAVHFGLGTYTSVDAVRILWPKGDMRGEFELKGDGILSIEHLLGISCPFLFTWNGDKMEFVTDCIWRSPLGLKINAQETFGIQMTEDWVKIRGDQLVPRPIEGSGVRGQGSGPLTSTAACSRNPEARPLVYDLRITAELWETHFFDHLSLMTVDHPVGIDIFCDERFAIPPPPLMVYATTPPRPVSRVWDDDGNDVTEIVRERNGSHVANFPRGAYQGVTRDHWLELEFGEEVPPSEPLYLIAHGWIRPTNSSVNVAMSQGDHPLPTGLSIEAPDANGVWSVRKENLGFPEGKVKTIVLRIDDVFVPGGPRRLRLCTNLEVFWDALQWATGVPDAPIQTTRLPARAAELAYRGFSHVSAADDTSPELPASYEEIECRGPKWRDLTGYYTRHGDIQELLADVDDRYVIMNAGDEIRLTFDVPPPAPPGWTRDFVLIGDGWVKDGNFNTTFCNTVLPLPAHDLPDYNTPPGRLEDDPVYRRHPEDWQTYHTRYVTPARFHRGLRPFRLRERDFAALA